MQKKSEFDDVTLAMSVAPNQREAILRALDYERNPDEQYEQYVCEVMDTLFEIKLGLKHQVDIQKRIDEVIKFAVRKNADKDVVKQYFKVAPPIYKRRVENSVEMLHRLMQIFEDPLDFSSCIEFNFKNLKDLMGDDFITQNSDIISETEYAPAVYMQELSDTPFHGTSV